MGNLQRVIIVLIIVFLVGWGTGVQAETSDRFLWIYSTDAETYSVDVLTFKNSYPDKNLLHYDAWIKTVYNEKGKEKVINSRKKFNLTIKGYEYLSYSMQHFQFLINTETNIVKIKLIEWFDYNANGEVIYSSNYNDLTWNSVPPNSIGEDLALSLKKYTGQINYLKNKQNRKN